MQDWRVIASGLQPLTQRRETPIVRRHDHSSGLASGLDPAALAKRASAAFDITLASSERAPQPLDSPDPQISTFTVDTALTNLSQQLDAASAETPGGLSAEDQAALIIRWAELTGRDQRFPGDRTALSIVPETARAINDWIQQAKNPDLTKMDLVDLADDYPRLLDYASRWRLSEVSEMAGLNQELQSNTSYGARCAAQLSEVVASSDLREDARLTALNRDGPALELTRKLEAHKTSIANAMQSPGYRTAALQMIRRLPPPRADSRDQGSYTNARQERVVVWAALTAARKRYPDLAHLLSD